MYRRLIILSMVILGALCGLVWLGYHSIRIRAQGLEGSRLGEFAAVAEQIRQDVTRKLNEFIQTEQKRPYTDYQYYYVPENVAPGQQQMPLLRSPLGAGLYNEFAYGNFQIEPDGTIVTPYYVKGQSQAAQENILDREAEVHVNNIKRNLLPVLNEGTGVFESPVADSRLLYSDINLSKGTLTEGVKEKEAGPKQQTKAPAGRSREYRIESLQADSQKEQILTQKRSVVTSNIARSEELLSRRTSAGAAQDQIEQQDAVRLDQQAIGVNETQQPLQRQQADVVEIRIEPFFPLIVPGANAQQSMFGGQVFLLRHVQIEDRHMLQGFQLNEKRLIEQVEESASRFVRKGMRFELPQTKKQDTDDKDVAYTAILHFGFGDLILNLKEIDPAWIGKEISHLRNWYLSIIGIVLLAVALGLAGLWRSARAQIKLAQKKDDFISAVSHELRTPLTSIRMYSEMLEKNWVKSEDKLTEYYRNMRQESERLSRLIENVLDFSRIQKGRKKYTFKVGDINKCVEAVVEMMKPYAVQGGFSIKTELGRIEQSAFDSDAVTQIVVNLLDNAVKYAHDAKDKKITVRTRSEGRLILIEVEDHGPGVPHRQRKKIFEQFYRSAAEATRETTGTGLGLALVKKFAEAHNGFVEIINARPTGSIFRVALAVRS
jgi:signal transduction histidine kinase